MHFRPHLPHALAATICMAALCRASPAQRPPAQPSPRPPKLPAGARLVPAAPGPDAPATPDGLEPLEDLLRRELERRLGPAAEYRVRLDRAGTDLQAGRLGAIDVEATEVRTRGGLVLSRLEMALEPTRLVEGMKLDRESIRGRFSAYLNRQALNQALRQGGSERFRDMRLHLRRGRIVVEGRPEVLGVSIASEVAGRPVLRRRGEVHFRAERVKVLGVRITELAASTLERKINPVLDFSRLDLPVRLERVRVRSGHLVLSGAADLSRLQSESGRDARGGGRRPRRDPDGGRSGSWNDRSAPW